MVEADSVPFDASIIGDQLQNSFLKKQKLAPNDEAPRRRGLDWDLKRDERSSMERLRRATDRAINRIIDEIRAAESSSDDESSESDHPE